MRSTIPGKWSISRSWKRGSKMKPGLGGVVVGEDDDRPLGFAIAGLGDHVPGRPLRPDQLAERP